MRTEPESLAPGVFLQSQICMTSPRLGKGPARRLSARWTRGVPCMCTPCRRAGISNTCNLFPPRLLAPMSRDSSAAPVLWPTDAFPVVSMAEGPPAWGSSQGGLQLFPLLVRNVSPGTCLWAPRKGVSSRLEEGRTRAVTPHPSRASALCLFCH